jgi:hypothetical protein
MPVDWSKVTVDHIRQACELFGSGAAIPKRPAKSTFLVFNGKSYPAKFIRGLAYRIATGVELNPSTDYSGGDETIRFFAGLGLQTSASVKPDKLVSTPLLIPPPIAVQAAPTKQKYEPQKQALFDLLQKKFGTVQCEAEFPWLVVPALDDLTEPISSIYHALQAMRGLSTFAKAGRSLRCDFCIPQEHLIVEYDERQHFTIQRSKSLELYPADLSLGFDRTEWITACKSIKATDLSPLYRDEQRAYYDSLRDILAARHGYRLIRFRQGDFDWTCQDAEEKLASAITRPTPISVAAIHSTEPTATEMKRIALVSHDYNLPDSCGRFDYSEYFARINKLCDDNSCDTILYALYTWDINSPLPRTHDSIFGGLKHIRHIILEVGQPHVQFDHVEAWVRGKEQPILAYQRFATSGSPTSNMQQLIDDLPSRTIGPALLLICGESNIVKLKRATKTFEDWFGFGDCLDDLKTRVILNPIHDYMVRYEMREKRRYFSRNGRTVVSVWNQGRGKESWLPWTVFRDGEEVTESVQEIENPIPERPDIRIGIFGI